MVAEQTRENKAWMEEATWRADKQNWQVLVTDWSVRERGERFQALEPAGSRIGMGALEGQGS